MNDFESTLVAALRQEAEEISVNVDIDKGAEQLEVRLSNAERNKRRTTWVTVGAAVAAAAAIAVVVVVVRSMGSPSSGEVIAPAPQVGKSYSTSSYPGVPFTVTLPAWTTGIVPPAQEEFGRHVIWEQSECTANGARVACLDGSDLKLRFLAPAAFYRPQDGPTASAAPDYAGYVAHLKAIAATGDVTITGLTSTMVDGRPATVMTLAPQKSVPGSLGCESEFDVARDCWGLPDTETDHVILRLAVIDSGGSTPMLAWMRANRSNPRAAVELAQLDTMLTSLRFSAAPRPSAS